MHPDSRRSMNSSLLWPEFYEKCFTIFDRKRFILILTRLKSVLVEDREIWHPISIFKKYSKAYQVLPVYIFTISKVTTFRR